MRSSVLFVLGMLWMVGACGDNIHPEQVVDDDLIVTPSSLMLEVGETATVTASYQTQVGTEPATDAGWNSTDPSRASVLANGAEATITAVAAGTAVITVSGRGHTATVQVTVTPSPSQVVSLEVTPATASIPAGRTTQLTATATYGDNSTADVTSQVTWTTTSAQKATVDSAGLVRGVAIGSAAITATLGSASDAATIEVLAPVLETIEVEPGTPSVAAGLTVNFIATGIYSDGSNADITAQVAWTSSNETVATIAASGAASTLATGMTTVTATLSGLMDTATLTVTDAELVSIDLQPAAPTLALGTQQQMTAVGTFTDGSTEVLTNVDWTTSDGSVATVSATGLVDAVATGTAEITATAQGTAISATETVTVTQVVLESIVVAPSQPTVSRLTTLTFTATGMYSDGSMQALPGVTWSSSNTSVAQINMTSGFTQTPNTGTAMITATDPDSGLTGSTTLTVTQATLVRIEVAPFSTTLARGTSEAYTATGIYSDATTQDLTTEVTWSSSDQTVATISNATGTEGIATTLANGTTTITALHAASGLSATATLRVGLSILVSIEILPANPTVPKGSKLQLRAIGHYDDGSTRDLTDFLSWSPSSPNVASVSTATRKKGLVTAKNVGTTTITATDTATGIQGTTQLTVSDATLTAIVVSPLASTIPNHTRQYFTATGVFSDNSTADMTTVVTWSSSNTGVATISNQTYFEGAATAVASGTTTITATYGTISSSTPLTVSNATLVSIAVTPSNPNFILGLPQQMTATGTFSDGSMHVVTREVTWSSSNTQIANVSNATPGKGLLSSFATGTVTITAQFPQTTISGTTNVTIIP